MSPPHLHDRVFTDPVSCREVIMAVDRAVQECQEPGHAIPGSLSHPLPLLPSILDSSMIFSDFGGGNVDGLFMAWHSQSL